MHSTFTLDWPTTTQHLKWASGTTRRSFQTYPIFWPPQVDSSPLAQILVRTISFSFWVFIWTQMIPKLDIQNILTFALDSRKQRTQPVTTSPKQKTIRPDSIHHTRKEVGDEARTHDLQKILTSTRFEPTTYKIILTSTRLEPHIHTSNKLEVPPQAYSTHIMLIIILRKAWTSHTAPPRNYDSSCLPF